MSAYNNCPVCNEELVLSENKIYIECVNKFNGYKIEVSHYNVRLYYDVYIDSEIFYLYDKYCIVRRMDGTEIFSYDYLWNRLLCIDGIIPFNKFNSLKNLNKLLLML